MRRRRSRHDGGWFLFFSWGLLRCRRDVDHRSGHAAPCHLRRDGTREVGFCFFFGGCSGVGGMLTTGVVMRRRVHRSGHAAPCHLRRDGTMLTTGVVMRRRGDGTRSWGLFFGLGDSFTRSGEMARGRLVFVFSLEVAPVSEGDSFTRYGEGALGGGFCPLWGLRGGSGAGVWAMVLGVGGVPARWRGRYRTFSVTVGAVMAGNDGC